MNSPEGKVESNKNPEYYKEIVELSDFLSTIEDSGDIVDLNRIVKTEASETERSICEKQILQVDILRDLLKKLENKIPEIDHQESVDFANELITVAKIYLAGHDEKQERKIKATSQLRPKIYLTEDEIREECVRHGLPEDYFLV